MSYTLWEQACLPIIKTGAGIKRSADEVQAAYVFHSSVLVEKITGHNPTEDLSSAKAIEDLSEIATTYPPQKLKVRKNLITQPSTTC